VGSVHVIQNGHLIFSFFRNFARGLKHIGLGLALSNMMKKNKEKRMMKE
jgi:hypothetical protein